ncbi:MAG: alpha/beta hydrolase [Flavobacteriaceae bacterium]|nr:alpha/beta hydrolase [Flavobacteriaceae bacterium]
MPIWIIIALAVLFVWIAISVVLYFIQDSMIFHAEKLPLDYEFSFNYEFEELNLKTDDGENLNGLIFRAKSPKGAFLLFHNHSGNLNHWSRTAISLNNLNYDVLMMDYRGFGKSTGQFNEDLMLKDALLWYDLMLKFYDEDSIIVYGRGLGAAFATYVSSKNNPSKLVLEAPIYSVYETAKIHYPYIPIKLILKYKFETYKYIEQVKCKTYIFHGIKDELVPFKNSEMLHQIIQDHCELLLIPEGDHYDLINSPIYLDKIEEITRKG